MPAKPTKPRLGHLQPALRDTRSHPQISHVTSPAASRCISTASALLQLPFRCRSAESQETKRLVVLRLMAISPTSTPFDAMRCDDTMRDSIPDARHSICRARATGRPRRSPLSVTMAEIADCTSCMLGTGHKGADNTKYHLPISQLSPY